MPGVRLKILPASIGGCYGTSSSKRGDHDGKQNTLRTNPGQNCGESPSDTAERAAIRIQRKYFIQKYDSSTIVLETPRAQAAIANRTQGDQLKTLIKNINSPLRERLPKPKANQSRHLAWVETSNMEAWTCAACNWAFLPSGPPLGESLEEMMENYERQRDMEFSSHVCAQHPKQNAVRDRSNFSYPKTVERTTRTSAQSMSAKA